ncbi:complement C3-like, partial [Pseudochaenichthys georgianus]|uniref:complement C3-like n=1 Tax=Pseudochaenichthys georgianus TaxID=52239 RepID=UPI00146A3E87
MIDVNNGIPSMQNPFKIPIKPKLGIWSIEAAYSDDFTTTARAEFEVKEYVLPSFYILVEPDTNYVSSGNFKRFNFKVSARYVHGAPVAEGEVFLRYGYVSGTNPPVIIPSSVSRVRKRNEKPRQRTIRHGHLHVVFGCPLLVCRVQRLSPALTSERSLSYSAQRSERHSSSGPNTMNDQSDQRHTMNDQSDQRYRGFDEPRPRPSVLSQPSDLTSLGG